MLTPSGRFNVGTKICLTNSSYHKGDWSSTWNILSILIAFNSIWLDDNEHGISHITDTPANRNAKANLSEDEKLALQLGADGLRKSSRVAGPPKSLYGPSSRIPVGAFNLPKIPSNKMKQPETAPKDNRPNKKSSLND